MEGGVTLQTAIADVLATSDHKRQEVVTEWPHIATAFKTYKLNLGNRIAPKTFEASYERYLNIALLVIAFCLLLQTIPSAICVLTPRDGWDPPLSPERVRYCKGG